jgi:hypothetical protein
MRRGTRAGRRVTRAVELTQPRQFGSQHADLSALSRDGRERRRLWWRDRSSHLVGNFSSDRRPRVGECACWDGHAGRESMVRLVGRNFEFDDGFLFYYSTWWISSLYMMRLFCIWVYFIWRLHQTVSIGRFDPTPLNTKFGSLPNAS